MGTKSWMLDETAHAGEEHLDPHYVQGYDRKAGTNPEEDLSILRRLGLDEGHTLVDFGAGTGTMALAAAPLCHRVVAIDVSPPMLRILQQQVELLGLSNLESVRGGFLSYQHEGELADFVYSRNALHHLPDFWKVLALERIAAVLKPGGRLLLRDLTYSFEPSETEEVFASWFAAAAKSADVGWTQEEFEVHIRTEYSTFSWLLESMLERAGFQIEEVNHSPAKVYSAYVCVKR